MAKEDNLISIADRPDRQEILHRAALNAARTKRRKKDLRETAKMLLDMEIPPTQEQTRSQMRALGIEDEDMTYAMQINIAMLIKASKGDVNAAKFLKETAGVDMDAEKLLEGNKEVNDVVIYLPDNGRDTELLKKGDK